MRRFIRRLMFIGFVVWVTKTIQDRKRQWSTRPAADIRQDVLTNLPSGIDPDTREKIADKVVRAVKGPAGADTGQQAPPAAQEMTSPPPPEPPSDLRRDD